MDKKDKLGNMYAEFLNKFWQGDEVMVVEIVFGLFLIFIVALSLIRQVKISEEERVLLKTEEFVSCKLTYGIITVFLLMFAAESYGNVKILLSGGRVTLAQSNAMTLLLPIIFYINNIKTLMITDENIFYVFSNGRAYKICSFGNLDSCSISKHGAIKLQMKKDDETVKNQKIKESLGALDMDALVEILSQKNINIVRD